MHEEPKKLQSGRKAIKMNVVMWDATSAITGEQIRLILVESYNDTEHLVALKLGGRLVRSATYNSCEDELIRYAKLELAAVDGTFAN